TFSEETFNEQLYLQYIYDIIGYICMRVSAVEGKGWDKLKAEMNNKVSLFIGHSGDGKSTWLNALETGLNMNIKEISEQHQQGQHTTTFAEMYYLSFNAKIIDTP